jgi:hypothetical protein
MESRSLAHEGAVTSTIKIVAKYRMTSADWAALNMLLYRQIIPNVPD